MDNILETYEHGKHEGPCSTCNHLDDDIWAIEFNGRKKVDMYFCNLRDIAITRPTEKTCKDYENGTAIN
jgi:hypothetical protein